MNDSLFEGTGVAIITPMKPNGDIHYRKMEELIEFQIENCTDAIVVADTTGEAACLDMQEHFDLIKFPCEVVDKRIPVIAGSGSNNTRHSNCTCGKRGKW